MNDNLRKSEREYSISKPDEDFIIDSNLDDDIYSIKNNLKQKDMEKFEDLFKGFKPENSEKDFKKIAKALMTEFVIKINETEFYLTEIEFYCKTIKNDSHQDPYVHGDDLQKEFGKWYFHGSGLDITFGNENFYGGILLRGIKTYSANEWKYTSLIVGFNPTLFAKKGPFNGTVFSSLGSK